MWIVSFVGTGVVKDDQEAQKIYQKVALVAVAGTAVSLPLLGYISDKFGAHITLPASFAVRGAALSSFWGIKNPNTVLSFTMSSLVIIASAMQASSIEALFLKTVPKEIRGAMVGTLNLFGNIGLLLFTHFGGQAFDKISPKSPFLIIACGDWIVFLTAIILVSFGLVS